MDMSVIDARELSAWNKVDGDMALKVGPAGVVDVYDYNDLISWQ